MRYALLVLVVFVLTVLSSLANQKITSESAHHSLLMINEVYDHFFFQEYKGNAIKSEEIISNFDSTETIVSTSDTSIILSDNFTYAKEILKKYLYAIGGEDLLREVNDRIIDMKGIVEGVKTEITFYQKSPNKLCQIIIVGEVEQKIIFDGTNGIKIIGDIKQEITGDELIKLSYDAIMDLVLEPESFDVNVQYKGLEKIEGRDAYKILLTLPNGAEWQQYYDMETGLKVRDSKEIITPQGVFEQITEFNDYRITEGIRYPYRIKQYLGSQTLSFTVESIQVNSGFADDVFNIE